MSTFKGGIHPKYNKEITMDKAIKRIENLPLEMVFPIQQHIGAPAKVIVNVGDTVKMGQIIAEANGFISANVLSSISGKVTKIEKRLDLSGNMTECIVIENDNLDTKIDNFGVDRDYTQLTNEEIVKIVLSAGIVGLGGACFPTHVKLSPSNANDIKYVLVNGCECEPYLTSDYRLMLEEGEKIILGLKIFLKLFPNAKCLICIEDNKPLCISKMQEITKNENNIEVKVLDTKYPEGGERQLIFAATGIKINSKTLPAQKGCIVDNVDTVIAIYNAVCKQIPLVRRIMTLTGNCFNNPGNYEVRFGMSYQHLINEVGGFSCEPLKIISGGPMMGMPMFDLTIPVSKNSSAIIANNFDEVDTMQTHCINCGRCVTACPENLIPAKMAVAAEHYDYESFISLYGMECIECGSCAYACPARIPLVQFFKIMKRKTANYLKEGGGKK